MIQELSQAVSKAVTPAVISGGSAGISFFAETLPIVQWCAGAIAIVSGVLAAAWVVFQYLQTRKGK